jgi:hypothetical protein
MPGQASRAASREPSRGPELDPRGLWAPGGGECAYLALRSQDKLELSLRFFLLSLRFSHIYSAGWLAGLLGLCDTLPRLQWGVDYRGH